MYAGLCAIYWSNGWLLIFEEEAQLQREPTWTACSWSSVWKSKRRWDLKIGVEALTQPNTMKSGSRPTFLKPGGIPHICHFFTQAIFLENKIYTKKRQFLPIFRVKSLKIYTSQKNFTRGARDKYEVWTPPPFMANAILNFHFDFLNTSLIQVMQIRPAHLGPNFQDILFLPLLYR